MKGIRVPMIVRWPGHVPAGTMSNRPTGFDDWTPTLLELAGGAAPPAGETDGVSFAPTLLGLPDRQQPREFLYWEFPSYGGQQAVRLGDWKGIRQNLLKKWKPGEAVDMSIELYNLKDDIGEQRNVAKAHPEIVARIAKIMAEQHVPSTLFPFAPLDRP
ncbi:MAG: sulfatase-like hydrolase/transferase [Planctomycetaceae bacterium]